MAEADIKALVEALNNTNEDERYKARSDLASALRKLVTQINVGFAQKLDGFVWRGPPYFSVKFKTGQIEAGAPNIEDAFDPNLLLTKDLVADLARWGYDVIDPVKAMIEHYADVNALEELEGAHKDSRSWERFVRQMAKRGVDVNNYEQMAQYAAKMWRNPSALMRKERAIAEKRRRSGTGQG